MTNVQYIEKILSSVDRIIVDTSTLMTRGFQQFIHNNKDRFLVDDKKIIVPKAVYTELVRHLSSTDKEKRECAMGAINLLTHNKSIFCIESAPLSEDEITHAFADAELLSELTLYRQNCNQLLITNDRRLSCDAFDLNQQQSCKGRRILVCYVNWCGELQCCDCARIPADRPPKERIYITHESDKTPTNHVPQSNSETIAEEAWEFDWASGILALSSAGLIYGLYRGGKALLHNIA